MSIKQSFETVTVRSINTACGALIDAYQFPLLTEAQRSEVYNMLDKLVYEFSHYPEGLESHNQTPEETVLMYIVSGLFC